MKLATRPGGFAVLLIAALSIVALALVTGCPDDSANMATRISQGGSSSPRQSDTSTSSTSTSAQPGIRTQAADDEPMPGEADDAASEQLEEGGEEAAVEEEYTGPLPIMEIVEVIPPYPMYEDAGSYDIKLNIYCEETDEYTGDYSTWKIIAFDVEGQEVGTRLEALKLPVSEKRARTYIWNGFYCSAKPDAFEMRLTDKEAVAAEEGEGSGSTGGGSSRRGRGGSGSDGDRKVAERGLT